MRIITLWPVLVALFWVLSACSQPLERAEADIPGRTVMPMSTRSRVRTFLPMVMGYPDAGGPVAWSALYGGEGSEEVEGLALTADGGLIASGSTDSFADPNGDAWLIRVDGDGQVRWQKTYGGPGDDWLVDVQATPDGGFIAVGFTRSFGAGQEDVWVLKLAADGTIHWQKTYGGPKTDQGWSVALTPDGGYLVVGATESFGAGRADYWVLKLDASGNVVWAKAYGGPGDDGGASAYGEYVVDALVDADGNYVVVSVTDSFGHGGTDYWVLKLAPDGAILWQKAIGGEDEEGVWRFALASNGDYIIPGYTVSFSPDASGDLWIVRLSPAGEVVWQKRYAVPGRWDEALTVTADSAGGALVGAYVEEPDDWDWYVFRVDAAGAVQWSQRFESGWDWPTAAVLFPDGSFAVAGVFWPNRDAPFDLWLSRLRPDGRLAAGCSFLRTVDLQVADTRASVMDTQATVTDTPVTPQASRAVVRATDGRTAMLCRTP